MKKRLFAATTILSLALGLFFTANQTQTPETVEVCSVGGYVLDEF